MGFHYILRRLAVMVPVFFLVVAMVFFMIRFAPGGPFDSERQVPPEIMKNLEAKYNLDQPLIVQFGMYLRDLAHFDLGPSFKYANRTVNEIIAESFPVSVELGLLALMWALIIGVGAGMVAALKPNSALDYFPMSFSILGICLPTFVIGPLLVLCASGCGWNGCQSRAGTLGKIAFCRR
jgi:oligopeptide transport system permease protein